MCGRYTLFDEQDDAEIASIIAQVNRKYPEQPIHTGDIFPTQTAPVLTADEAGLTPKLFVWGFPKYTGSGILINARAETAAEKKTFRQSLLTRRCLVLSTGFYEWDEQKKKYLFRLPGESILYMAGIFSEYEGVRRYVILTTSANDSMRDVHHRMPVIVPRNKIQMWMADTHAALAYLHSDMPVLIRLK